MISDQQTTDEIIKINKKILSIENKLKAVICELRKLQYKEDGLGILLMGKLKEAITEYLNEHEILG